MSRSITLTFETDEDCALIREYARSRGEKHASALLRVALFEYIRRHRPTAGTVLRERIDGFVGDISAPAELQEHEGGE